MAPRSIAGWLAGFAVLPLTSAATARAQDPFASDVRPTPWLAPEDERAKLHVPDGFVQISSIMRSGGICARAGDGRWLRLACERRLLCGEFGCKRPSVWRGRRVNAEADDRVSGGCVSALVQ